MYCPEMSAEAIPAWIRLTSHDVVQGVGDTVDLGEEVVAVRV
jgi:hypothetical protein